MKYARLLQENEDIGPEAMESLATMLNTKLQVDKNEASIKCVSVGARRRPAIEVSALDAIFEKVFGWAIERLPRNSGEWEIRYFIPT